MIPVLLSVTALIAYLLGGTDVPEICCRRFLGRELRSYGRGQRGLEAFYRENGPKGAAITYVPEILKIGLAVLIGGWLLGIKGHADVGREFALFCLIMGAVFPFSRRFVGGRGFKELLAGMFFVSPGAGFLTLVVFSAVLWATKYLTLAGICAAVGAILGIWVFVETRLALELSVFCAIIIIVRHAGHILRLIKHTEPKIQTKKDLSYKFDEDF
jgi:glycerol-3-phosphate acyltransferase PlsY